ncbi:NAD dependent epimerase/dehydratase family protein [Penicillium coprophilum]|uniref:NAD dependent epimerase/dehydratase family protein n=1 Tax=Penicillium coprophilum TaxID=36646 RepID=UPI00239AEE80|nr:NAD dependent epimerase/dehydratase family protein [Penicillium coprophilum]KAJ5164853.1 NAD dependent epimerase/dehydratase family protein [Penicillium coprophilum]
MTPRSLLITGVSGYIGGTVLSSILEQQDQWTKLLKISALVRSKSQASTVQNLGVLPVMFSSFDETEALEEIAKDFDVIIHAGAGWHTSSAKALITGQGARKAALSRPVHYIQISGTSNLSDRPHTDGYTDTHQFNDEEDIFSYEKYRESREAYYQRTTDITVVEAGEALGVTTYVVMAPTVYGLGTGSFNRSSIQLPAMIADAIKSGMVSVVSEGKTIWSHVHVQDLASLHLTLLQYICTDSQIPSGRKGIYFCETGEHSHREFSELLAKAAYELDVLPTAEVKKITLQEAGDKLALGSILRAELSFGANARCKAVLGRKLGWTPLHTADWETSFHTEVSAFIKNPPRERELPKLLK